MFNLKSWRWSRLFESSAWKRVVTHWNQIFLIVLVGGLVGFIFYKKSFEENYPQEIFWICLCIAVIFSILATVCMADEYFEIKANNKSLHKIYLYNHGLYFSSDKIEMTIISKLFGEEYITKEKITEDYCFWHGSSSFLFCMNDTYYYLSPSFQNPEILGKKKTETSFFSEATKVNILDGINIFSSQADCFIYDKAFVPPVAVNEIKAHGRKARIPDKYLIAKTGTNYTIYGLYEDYPRVLLLQIPIIIFKDMGQDVVLVWEEKSGYREIFRTQASVKRSLSNVFVELTDKPKISGIIRRLNEQTMQIETLYEGRFYAIDFDSGSVTGENGFEYNPS